MNDETKEILIDLIDYWNTMGTESDPGMEAFCSVVQRASKALERNAKGSREGNEDKKSVDVDPFANTDKIPAYKMEGEW